MADEVGSLAGGAVAALSSRSWVSETSEIRRMIRWARGRAPGSARQIARSTSARCSELDTSAWPCRAARKLVSATDSGSLSASLTSAEESR